MSMMPVDEVITRVAQICKDNNVQKLVLIGSFATGTSTPTSDLDFVVYGCKDVCRLERSLESIESLRKIDIYEFERIKNAFLLEDIEKYGKQIY